MDDTICNHVIFFITLLSSFSASKSKNVSSLTPSQKGQLMDEVKQQLAIANVQELLAEMTKKCFNKCVSKPGSSLDSSEQKCVAMCMDRFMDSWNLVSRTYSKRIESEHNRQ